MSLLVIDLERCTGCQNCELACSVRNTRTFNPARSRIHILKDEVKSIVVPMVCLQCDEPLCRDACPSSAVVMNSAGVLTVDHESCIGCQNCVTACIYGGVTMDPVTRKAVKCDLCGGEPACVKACEYKAITIAKNRRKGLKDRQTSFDRLYSFYGLGLREARR